MQKIWLSCIFAILLCSACSDSSGEDPDKRSGGSCRRIVSLSPALTELVFHLGKGSLLAGRSDACNYPAQAESIPVAGSFAQPSAETVLRLKPDLILSNALVNPRQKKIFEQAGITVILQSCDTLEDYRKWFEILGEKLSAEESARQELSRLDQWLEQNRRKPQTGKRALLLLWDDPVMAAGSGTLPDTALRLAGLKNVLEQENGYVKCSAEFLLRSQPDILIWAVKKPYENAAGFVKKISPSLVIDESFDYDVILRPGPRFTAGVDALRKRVEP